MYTPEGQIKAFGALARGLKNDDPRHRRYRRQMQRTGLIIAGSVIALVALVAVIADLL
jgi:tmRNA-binding protein